MILVSSGSRDFFCCINGNRIIIVIKYFIAKEASIGHKNICDIKKIMKNVFFQKKPQITWR